MKGNDLTGKKFGKLTVLSLHSRDNFGRYRWLCQCECGNTSVVQAGNLKNGGTTACGCGKNKPSCNRKSLVGKVFKRLTVIDEVSVKGKLFAFCTCICGTEVIVWGAHLRSGHTSSCGCYKREQSSKAIIKRLTGRKGKQSPAYNFNIPDSERNKRRSSDSKEWSRKILRIHNFTCVKCQTQGRHLHAHHLNGYARYKELRLRLSNGVCLCKNCHKKYHSEFGVKNTIEEDFHKWVGAPPYDISDTDLRMPVGTHSNYIKIIQLISSEDIKDIKKARWYLDRHIQNLENEI